MEDPWEFEIRHRDGANNPDATRFVTFRASQTSVSEDVWVLWGSKRRRMRTKWER